MRRRDVLIIGAAIAAAVSLPPILRRRTDDLAFRPIRGFEGFRRLDGGAVTSVPDPFVGLDGPAPAAPDLPPCQALFGTQGWTRDQLPIAVFTDVNCPNCAILESRLFDLEKSGAPIRLIWQQFPLLGPRSLWAAKVTLAAALQNAADAVHRDLMQHVLRPGIVGLRDLAERHDLNAEKLMADAQGSAVQASLDDAMGLGAALGIPGTPSIVVGRTLVIGVISAQRLTQLIELERSADFDGCN